MVLGMGNWEWGIRNWLFRSIPGASHICKNIATSLGVIKNSKSKKIGHSVFYLLFPFPFLPFPQLLPIASCLLPKSEIASFHSQRFAFLGFLQN